MPDTEPQLVERVLRATRYIVIVLAGVAALVLTPRTIEGALGAGFTLLWSSVAFVGSVLAAYGTLANRYRIELSAIWLVAGGVSAYGVTVWALAFTTTPTRATQALLVTALVLGLCARGVSLSRRAAVVRRAHTTIKRRG